MTYYIQLKEGSDHFLTKCLDLFPDGIPVTSKDPLNDFDFEYMDWVCLSLLNKLKYSFNKLRPGPLFWETLSNSFRPWQRWLFPKTRLYFYLLDSKALDSYQYQKVKKELFNLPEEVLIKLKKELETQLGAGLDKEVTPEYASQLLMDLALNPNDPLDKVPISLDNISRVPS